MTLNLIDIISITPPSKNFLELEAKAKMGDPKAQCELGLHYSGCLGRSGLVDRDYAGAAAWFGKAARQGYAPAMINLGTMYANAHGVPRNIVRALFWFKKAADQNKTGEITAIAFSNIAYLHADRNTAEGEEAARLHLSKAAELGHDKSERTLALLDTDPGMTVVKAMDSLVPKPEPIFTFPTGMLRNIPKPGPVAEANQPST